MSWIVYVLIGLVCELIIAYIVACKFSEIAEMKGHKGREYFWYTFWLGICGMLMVVALPNLKAAEKKVAPVKPIPANNEPRLQPTEQAQTSNIDNPPVSAIINNGEKVCPKCGLSQRANRSVCWSCGQRFDN